MLSDNLKEGWRVVLKDIMQTPNYQQLEARVNQAYNQQQVFPPKAAIFNALNQVTLNDIKVVILGQDPYHGPNQANGLSFSVNEGMPLPPSLQNIFKELASDLEIENKSGDLTPWAQQGVLLLNSVLTVEQGKAHSHKNWGWEIFTDEVLTIINQRKQPVVFILWGAYAQKKEKLINKDRHFVIKSAHPSPLSAYRGFFGSHPFSLTNQYLLKSHQHPIDWHTSIN